MMLPHRLGRALIAASLLAAGRASAPAAPAPQPGDDRWRAALTFVPVRAIASQGPSE